MAKLRNLSSSNTLSIFLFLFLFLFFFASVSLSNAQEHTWQEAFEALGIAWNPDGTLNRSIQIPMLPATPTLDDPNQSNPPVALSADIPDRHYRIYRPINIPRFKKLPLIISPHGGDFVLFSYATAVFHNFYNDVAAKLSVIIVAIDYRLAPENRLPAAYNDSLAAVIWARDQALKPPGFRHPWLEYADFSNTYLLGTGAGGNAAFHVALRTLDFNLWPLKINGLLLNQPYFGGVQRTPSEIRLKDDPIVALYVNDVLWTLVLPPPINRDHVFCNPIMGGSYGGRVNRLPKVYVKGDYGDPLVDRSTLLVQHLRNYRVSVVYQYSTSGPSSGAHGIEQRNSTLAQELYDGMKNFIYSIRGETDDDTEFHAAQ